MSDFVSPTTELIQENIALKSLIAELVEVCEEAVNTIKYVVEVEEERALSGTLSTVIEKGRKINE